MAYLGHSARIVVSTTSLQESIESWRSLGFTLERSDAGVARMTDGQILVTLMEQDFQSPAMAYFHADPERLASDLQGKGLAIRNASPSGFTVTPFDGVDVYVHQRPMETAERHTGAKNDVLGYLDAFSIGVQDVAATRRTAENIGFFVQEEWGMPQPRSDVTDGLMTVAFHQRQARPYLAYAVEITDDLVAHLQADDGLTVTVTEIDGEISYVRVTTPEGTRVVLLHDDNYE